jgi:hypothetical protein
MVRLFEGISTKLTPGQDSLKKALGYGLSVAIVADPPRGMAMFEQFAKQSNKHVLWIVRENLKKSRLARMDPDWVTRMAALQTP